MHKMRQCSLVTPTLLSKSIFVCCIKRWRVFVLIASFIVAFKSLTETGLFTSAQIAHKVQQLFLHLVKRLPTIAAIVYSQLLQFCGDDDDQMALR